MVWWQMKTLFVIETVNMIEHRQITINFITACAKCKMTATCINPINMRNILDLVAHRSLQNYTPPFLKCDSFKIQSICMQLCITLTCWPHLSVYLKSTFIQMCSVQWRLTLHNPSKYYIWRERLELFESSESSPACGGEAQILDKFESRGTKTFIFIFYRYSIWHEISLSVWPCRSLF